VELTDFAGVELTRREEVLRRQTKLEESKINPKRKLQNL